MQGGAWRKSHHRGFSDGEGGLAHMLFEDLAEVGIRAEAEALGDLLDGNETVKLEPTDEE